VTALIKEAFFLFWIDARSSANRIRSAIEELMTERGIQIAQSKTNRKAKLSLHHRIKLFEGREPEATKALEAIKWIGNAGSHSRTEEMSKADIISGFELLEHALELIYVKKAKRMARLAKRITKRKGRPIAAKIKKPSF
jgi:hypothetical protein